MSTENKFRELLTHKSLHHSYNVDEIPSYRDKSEYIHTIEIAAVEQLKDENEKVYDALAGNICGYCWQKMEEEPTAKRTHQDHVNELLAEITALKSKLEIAVEKLTSISKNSCCDTCQEAKLVALSGLSKIGGEM